MRPESRLGTRLRPPRWVVATAIVILLSLIAYVDMVTPAPLSMALFYLVPVAAATWLLSRRAGYAMACISALVWLWAELHEVNASHSWFTYFNATTRLGFFLFAVPVLSSWRMMGERLSLMVEARTAELRLEVLERQRAERGLRMLASELSAAEDAERGRLAYDLHDGMGQMLSLMKMNLQVAISEQPGTGKPTRGERLNDSVRMLDTLIDQTRHLIFNLHPAMIDDLGLVATLKGYARDFGQRSNIDVIVTEHGTANPPVSSLAHYLFRAVREVLNNAARHGQASEIVIAVHWEGRRLRIVVDDDGCGFDPATLRRPQGPGGLGLPGITERLRSLGGSFHVESKPGQGTRAILEVPIDLAETTNADDAPPPITRRGRAAG